MLYRLSQLADRCSKDVSTHDNVSYDIIVTAPSHSKDNKAPSNSSSKATPNSCELIYDTVDIDLRKQPKNEELQLYEIPDHESSMRDTEESYIYY